jgi:hypothetical protein
MAAPVVSENFPFALDHGLQMNRTIPEIIDVLHGLFSIFLV